MKSRTVFQSGTLALLMVILLPVTCFKLSKHEVDTELQDKSSLMADMNQTLIQPSNPTPKEVPPNEDSMDSVVKTSAISSMTSSEATNSPDIKCDRSKQHGVVIMISFNHFGFSKGNYLMQAAMDIMKSMQNRGIFVRLVIDDLVPRAHSEGLADKKDWVVTSMVRKLRWDTFSPIHSWELNMFGFLFVDKSIDLSDPSLMKEIRRVNFQDIRLYIVVVGDGVDMALLNKYIARRDQLIQISSYDLLHSDLISKLIEKLCVPPPKTSINIA